MLGHSLDLQSWLHDAPEDLDVYIAQRAFSDAVALASRARQYFNGTILADIVSKLKLSPTIDEGTTTRGIRQLKERIDACIDSLIDVLATELERPALQKQALRSIVLHLLTLNEPERVSLRRLESAEC